jgi:tRNA threonylcarbamoyladenosine biosynthesis protein TsaB
VLTLALDTTTRAGSLAVTRDATVLAVVDGDATRTHGERLPAEIAHVLDIAGVDRRELDLLVVANGPGAFTGLRIGLAAIQGVAMVLNLPVVAVSALDALALAAVRSADAPASGERVAAWMDAQRGEVFAAYYVSGEEKPPIPIAPPTVGTPATLLAELSAEATVFTGDGAHRYASQILQFSGARHRVIADPASLAPFIALIGQDRAAGGDAGPPHALQPLYVRRSDAELERQRRDARDAGRTR